ncbi:DUF72 domain-containing protein [Ideonella sp.]|uniref:DUF72 domain-containing protein n=1 Tax=Ideonella sp. TaxID=1929293 RepID=UPI0035B2431F
MALAPRGTVRIGISGWRYAPWRGVFYPPGLRQRDELAYAAGRMASIELNGSFYSLQRPAAWEAWAEATPPGFVFSVKGPRYLTHLRRLKDVQAPLANFLASGVLTLGARLGPLLWQFPPQMRWDAERFEAFFALLPRDTGAAAAFAQRHHDGRVDGRSDWRVDEPRALRHAVEVRHPSFVDPAFVAQLRRHGIALVVADTAGRWPWLEDLCTDFMYLRLHGAEELYASGYDDGALDHWARRITAWRRGRQVDDARLAAPDEPAPHAPARDIYCYFDNDIKVHAPFDAQRLAERLGVAPPPAAAPALRRTSRTGKPPLVDSPRTRWPGKMGTHPSHRKPT